MSNELHRSGNTMDTSGGDSGMLDGVTDRIKDGVSWVGRKIRVKNLGRTIDKHPILMGIIFVVAGILGVGFLIAYPHIAMYIPDISFTFIIHFSFELITPIALGVIGAGVVANVVSSKLKVKYRGREDEMSTKLKVFTKVADVAAPTLIALGVSLFGTVVGDFSFQGLPIAPLIPAGVIGAGGLLLAKERNSDKRIHRGYKRWTASAGPLGIVTGLVTLIAGGALLNGQPFIVAVAYAGFVPLIAGFIGDKHIWKPLRDEKDRELQDMANLKRKR